MILRPALSRSLDIVTNDDHGNIRCLRSLHCFGDPFVVIRRVTQSHIVFEPTWLLARRDFAAFGIINSDPVSNLLFDSLKNAYLPRGPATVFAKLNISGIRTNNRYRTNLIPVKRQQIVFVLQQRDCFMRRSQRELTALLCLAYS